MDEGFSGVARTWSDGASGGDLVTFFLYLGLDVSALSPVDRLEAFEDVMATHPNIPPIVHIELCRPSMAFPIQLYGECMVEIDFRLPWGEDYCS